jgi:lipopolysaccharide transport system ATP-binding protein
MSVHRDSDIVISVEHLSKRYRLGVIGHRTLTHDLQSWWARRRGKDDPNAPIVPGAKQSKAQREEILALNDVSFDVRRGEVLGIIGRNGAGKSTLLKILSRVTAQSAGEVKIKGRVASLLEVGTGFHPELTGRENIYLNGAILGMKRGEINAKFDDIVSFSELERFIDTPVKRYSSGMYVRLAFAVAAHLEPEILLIDEVLAVGDAAFQNKCLGRMGEISSKGRTVLFVSHDMAAVRSICSRCILLEESVVVADGPADAVVDSYLIASKDRGVRYRSTSGLLEWLGIRNRSENEHMNIGADVRIELELQTGSVPLHHLFIDLEIYNARNERVIHLKSKFVSPGWTVDARERLLVTFAIAAPRLAPGEYTIAVYGYSDEGELLWVDAVPLGTVLATPDFGSVAYIDRIIAAVIPRFDVSLVAGGDGDSRTLVERRDDT